MRRRVLEKLGGLNESFHYIMDQEFWVRALMSGFNYRYLSNEIFARFRLIKGTKTFDSGPKFNIEWHYYTLSVLNTKYFDSLPKRRIESLKKNSFMKYYFSNMTISIRARSYIDIIMFYLKTIQASPKVLLNLGLTKIFVLGLFGIEHNTLKKFKNNARKQ
jgi:GT2 family glycosyltransferase